jgi:hypothetical protein
MSDQFFKKEPHILFDGLDEWPFERKAQSVQIHLFPKTGKK